MVIIVNSLDGNFLQFKRSCTTDLQYVKDPGFYSSENLLVKPLNLEISGTGACSVVPSASSGVGSLGSGDNLLGSVEPKPEEYVC